MAPSKEASSAPSTRTITARRTDLVDATSPAGATAARTAGEGSFIESRRRRPV